MQIQIQTNQLRMEDLKVGDSICVNGVCLTVISFTENEFIADVMPETVQRTTFNHFTKGQQINLERSLRPIDGIDGHFVLGHINGTGILTKRIPNGNSIKLFFKYDSNLKYQIVEKGSIAVNGISLTVVQVIGNVFEVDIIPHTTQETTLNQLRIGGSVNLETDILGKYLMQKVGNKK
ncbi:riboflavin synthase subunit alpha [Pediococcus argentinicus]|uniref:Riboflavin synthase n=2 Tax=Pediococcus argentinicus TaxID=480391 RepID=A0A0R2NP10_9LACO|nr:riboflavin synthase subunit alpha [Pediococcus argentinicus]